MQTAKPWFLYKMVAHFTLRTYYVNKEFFRTKIWIWWLFRCIQMPSTNRNAWFTPCVRIVNWATIYYKNHEACWHPEPSSQYHLLSLYSLFSLCCIYPSYCKLNSANTNQITQTVQLRYNTNRNWKFNFALSLSRREAGTGEIYIFGNRKGI